MFSERGWKHFMTLALTSWTSHIGVSDMLVKRWGRLRLLQVVIRWLFQQRCTSALRFSDFTQCVLAVTARTLRRLRFDSGFRPTDHERRMLTCAWTSSDLAHIPSLGCTSSDLANVPSLSRMLLRVVNVAPCCEYWSVL